MFFVYSLISVTIVSLLSLSGLIVLFVRHSYLKSISNYLVSLAVGALFGDVFIHLLPQSFNHFPGSQITPLLIISGLLLFFILEKFIHWRHCHNADCHQQDHLHPVVTLSLIGDTLHNFIDGLIIAASYAVSLPLGLTTTLAIILHEIPQEIGDFGVLIHNGFSPSKALLLNLLTALSAVLGSISIFLFGANTATLSSYLLPFTAGGFLYLAGSDLIPELHQETRPRTSYLQLLFIIIGVALMYSLTTVE